MKWGDVRWDVGWMLDGCWMTRAPIGGFGGLPAPAPLRPFACPPGCSQGARSQFRQGGPAAGSRALWRSHQAPKERSQGTPSSQAGASRRTERHEQLHLSFLHLPRTLSSFPISLYSCRTASTSLFSPPPPLSLELQFWKGCMHAMCSLFDTHAYWMRLPFRSTCSICMLNA